MNSIVFDPTFCTVVNRVNSLIINQNYPLWEVEGSPEWSKVTSDDISNISVQPIISYFNGVPYLSIDTLIEHTIGYIRLMGDSNGIKDSWPSSAIAYRLTLKNVYLEMTTNRGYSWQLPLSAEEKRTFPIDRPCSGMKKKSFTYPFSNRRHNSIPA